MNDPYETLGLNTDAGEAEIRRRYLELVREFPPDRAPERFTAIHAAYEALRDPARRLHAQLFHPETKTDSLEATGGRPAGAAPSGPAAGRHPARAGGITMIDRPMEDIEAVLDRFRRWLEAARDEAGDLGADGLRAPHMTDKVAGDRPEFGLVNLVEEFTALRHELKLQTKSGRGLIEQTESTVAALRQAIEQFRSVEPKEAQAAWSAGKPMAEALGDLDEALARGRREIEQDQPSARRRAPTLALADAIDERFRRRVLAPSHADRRLPSPGPRTSSEGGGWLRRDLLDSHPRRIRPDPEAARAG